MGYRAQCVTTGRDTWTGRGVMSTSRCASHGAPSQHSMHPPAQSATGSTCEPSSASSWTRVAASALPCCRAGGAPWARSPARTAMGSAPQRWSAAGSTRASPAAAGATAPRGPPTSRRSPPVTRRRLISFRCTPDDHRCSRRKISCTLVHWNWQSTEIFVIKSSDKVSVHARNISTSKRFPPTDSPTSCHTGPSLTRVPWQRAP